MVIHGFRLGAWIAAAAALLPLLVSGAAFAATKGADLRVVNTAGQTLAQFRQYTGTVRIKTDPQADCFGPPGGSGDSATVRGATGLGIVKDGLAWDRRLRPLSVTDQFSFGLAVCAIGGYEAQGSSFWYLKRNHTGSQVAGDQLRLHDGDDVLWYLTPSFPPPPELVLRAPAQAQPGVPFQVRANQYLDDGTKAPAAGATVSGGTAPVTTGPQGTAMVTVAGPGGAKLQATRESDGAIPSNLVKVCVNSDPSRCPEAHGDRIFGSRAANKIRGTRGWDAIEAGGGGDVIDLRGGGRDRVNCGPGVDRVILAGGDGDDRIGSSCEQVVRR
jgi:hypothetical protein